MEGGRLIEVGLYTHRAYSKRVTKGLYVTYSEGKT